jgi:hypothetical protein
VSNQQTPPNQPSPIQVNLDEARRAHDKLDEFHTYVNEAAIKAGEIAIRMALLINGAAAIALLTFIGTLPKEQKRLLAETLASFAYGVAAAAAALAFSYFTNYFMAGIATSKLRQWQHPYIAEGPTTPRYRLLNRVCHVGAVVTGIAALILFISGVLQVRDALTKL